AGVINLAYGSFTNNGEESNRYFASNFEFRNLLLGTDEITGRYGNDAAPGGTGDTDGDQGWRSGRHYTPTHIDPLLTTPIPAAGHPLDWSGAGQWLTDSSRGAIRQRGTIADIPVDWVRYIGF